MAGGAWKCVAELGYDVNGHTTQMDDLSKEYVLSFFDRALSLHGNRPEAVRWTAEGQRARYEALLELGDLRGRRVLDYGCGKGDLYGFLLDRGIRADYIGCDINGNLIAAAKRQYPSADFRVLDIEQDALEEDVDYVLLCGVFNLKVEGVGETARNVLRLLYSRCRLGLAFNALSAHNPAKDFELNYFLPEEMAGFASSELSPHVVLRQDIVPGDFMLYVYREQNPR